MRLIIQLLNISFIIRYMTYSSFTHLFTYISTEQRFVINILRIFIRKETVSKQINVKQSFVRTQNDQKFQY